MLAGAMSDHLAKDGFFGGTLVKRLADVRVVSRQAGSVDLVTRIDRPLLAEDAAGRRHALPPGPVTADGRGPAACSSSRTVKLVLSVDGRPLRATARKEPGTVQPQCTKCRRRI